MIKSEILTALGPYDGCAAIICEDDMGKQYNIQKVRHKRGEVKIIFGEGTSQRVVTKSRLLTALKPYNDDVMVICERESGGWDNIHDIVYSIDKIKIIFGGGSPFSDE